MVETVYQGLHNGCQMVTQRVTNKVTERVIRETDISPSVGLNEASNHRRCDQ